MRFRHIESHSILVLLFLSLLLNSCVTSKTTNYLQEASYRIPTYKDDIGYQEYTLSPFDKLYIRIYSPDLQTNSLINGKNTVSGNIPTDYRSDLYTYTIDKDGKIKLPIAGEIRLDGLYVREAKSVIEQAIKSYILDDCAIDVKLVGRYFSIIGSEINGKFPIHKEKMNIFQALALGGGLGDYADRSKIKILRESPNGIEIKEFDIRSKDIINSDFYYIQPNDVIYIQEINSSFFAFNKITMGFATITSTISFGLFIYNFINSLKK